jgi:hypothetical protein
MPGRKGRRRRGAIPAAIVCTVLAATRAAAQDMEPRAYSPSPVGANFLVAGYSWSTGAVVFDPTLPITDVHADVQGVFVGAGHTFNLLGKLALVTAAIPYGHANVTGAVQEQRGEVTRLGLADARVKLSVNLIGNPAQSPREFAAAPHRTVVGASVTVSAPAGQYDNTKLINLGTNRWSFKPEGGVSVPIRRWTLDGYVGAWFYTANDAFFPGGSHRKQDPLYTLQAHASYTIRPRLWLAADSTWYRGGSSRTNEGAPSESMNNSRLGATISLPVGSRQSIKIAYASGLVARTGTDFSTVAIGWQMLWLSPRWSGR